MDTNLFTVFDAAANAFLEPFHAPTIEFAIREFRRAVNQEGHHFNRFPSDYTLFHVGQFDQSTGVITPSKTPTPLGVAITFLTPEGPQLAKEG